MKEITLDAVYYYYDVFGKKLGYNFGTFCDRMKKNGYIITE